MKWFYLVALISNSLWAASTFKNYVGVYSVVKVVQQDPKCLNEDGDDCVLKGYNVVIQSSEEEAKVWLKKDGISPKIVSTKMFEYDFSGEGRFSIARFTQLEAGAFWYTSSNGSSGQFVQIEQLGNGLYLFVYMPRVHPYDNRVYRLVLSI